MTEENLGFVNLIRNKINSFVFGPAGLQVPKSTEYIKRDRALLNALMKMTRGFTGETYSTTLSRKDKYKKYKNLSDNLAEASASLNVYADNIVSGAIGGEENYKVKIDPNAQNAEQIEEIIKFTEKKTSIKDYIWDIARDLTCDGDTFEEICVKGEEKTGYYIGKLKKLPPYQIYANVDERGVWIDPAKPYVQKVKEGDKEPDVEFDWWRIVHFKIGRDIYGVDRSIFANASQRIGRQLLYIDDALVLARISRAWMRYAFFIDVTDLSDQDKWEMVDAFMSRIRRTDVIDRDTGRVNYIDAPFMVDEDIGIPVEKGSPANVKQLTGDYNIGNIDDVKYLQTKFLMAMNVPKAYVAIEEGLRTKATLTQLDVQFARQVRRRQRALLPGLRKFYRIAFVLAGIDPDSFRWEIIFPELATTDEMLKFEMLKLKAEVAKILAVDVHVVNMRWVQEVLLEWTEDEIQKYAAMLPAEIEEGGERRYLQLAPETVRMIKEDPYVRQIFEDLQDVVAQRQAKEEVERSLKDVGVEREKELSGEREE